MHGAPQARTPLVAALDVDMLPSRALAAAMADPWVSRWVRVGHDAGRQRMGGSSGRGACMGLLFSYSWSLVRRVGQQVGQHTGRQPYMKCSSGRAVSGRLSPALALLSKRT